MASQRRIATDGKEHAMPHKMHEKDFAKCFNDAFHVMGEHRGAFSLRLIRISMEKSPPEEHVFSLLFHGSADKLLTQGIHHLKHHELGEVDVFLVPVSHDQQAGYYHAVFNHLAGSHEH
jgi:hypothetical protein